MVGSKSKKVNSDLENKPLGAQDDELRSEEFEGAFGESMEKTMDLDTWHKGEDMAEIFSRLTDEVQEAIHAEDDLKKKVRELILPTLATRDKAPEGAGVFSVDENILKSVQNAILFNGQVEACDGSCVVHDTLPLTIAQIGVVLVSYSGEQGSWAHRLYRRDLRMKGQDPLEEVLQILESRQGRSGVNEPSKKDTISNLARRGIMTYAERAVLLKKSQAPWRMGHGNPAPYELLTGSGSMELLDKGLTVLKELILDHKRIIFVPSAPADRHLITIGNALRPLEYAVIEDSFNRMMKIVEDGHLRGEHRKKAVEFYNEVGRKVVIGVYRTGAHVPPQMFYSHIDHVHEAAAIVMADSIIQTHRGFPTLIDLADNLCRSQFGAAMLKPSILSAYADLGQGLSYLNERETRD